jgi:uncharacterized protein YifE (UPF0438 family)
MSTADEHRRFLAKKQFFIPGSAAAQLSEPERVLLARYGHWLEALANGVLPPDTPAQRRFVRAARGEVNAASEFEVAWVKFRPPGSRRPPRRWAEPDDFEERGSYGQEGLGAGGDDPL